MKNNLKYIIGTLFSVGALLIAGSAFSQDTTGIKPKPKNEIKSGAHEVGKGTAKVAKGVAHGTTKAAKSVGKTTKKAAKDVKNDFKKDTVR